MRACTFWIAVLTISSQWHATLAEEDVQTAVGLRLATRANTTNTTLLKRFRYGDSDYADYQDENEDDIEEDFSKYFQAYAQKAEAALDSFRESADLEKRKQEATESVLANQEDTSLSAAELALLEDALAQASLEDEKVAAILEELGADMQEEEKLTCNPSGSYTGKSCQTLDPLPASYLAICPNETAYTTDCHYNEMLDMRYEGIKVNSRVDMFQRYVKFSNYNQCSNCNHNLQVFLCSLSFIPCGGLMAQQIAQFRGTTADAYAQQNETEKIKEKEKEKEEREEAIGNYVDYLDNDLDDDTDTVTQEDNFITLAEHASVALPCREVCEIIKDTCNFGTNFTLIEHFLNLEYFPEEVQTAVELVDTLYYRLNEYQPCELLRWSNDTEWRGKCPLDQMRYPDSDSRDPLSDCDWYYDDYPGMLAMMIVTKEVVAQVINFIKGPLKNTLLLVGLTRHTVDQIFLCADTLTSQTGDQLVTLGSYATERLEEGEGNEEVESRNGGGQGASTLPALALIASVLTIAAFTLF